jgi:hypothetical protein
MTTPVDLENTLTFTSMKEVPLRALRLNSTFWRNLVLLARYLVLTFNIILKVFFLYLHKFLAPSCPHDFPLAKFLKIQLV